MALVYYKKQATTTSYAIVNFGGAAKNVILANDGTEDIQISWNNSTLHGEIAAGETITLNDVGRAFIYIKSASGGMDVRIWAWKSDWS